MKHQELDTNENRKVSNIKELLRSLDEAEELLVTMTVDTEGELVIDEDNGNYSWSYNGQYQDGFKSANDAIKAFKKDMKRQGFRNIKIGD